MSSAISGRPAFPTAEDWLEHYREATAAGDSPWWPVTREELLLEEEHGILDIRPQWVPARENFGALGLPVTFRREPNPVPEETVLRLIDSFQKWPWLVERFRAAFKPDNGEGK